MQRAADVPILESGRLERTRRTMNRRDRDATQDAEIAAPRARAPARGRRGAAGRARLGFPARAAARSLAHPRAARLARRARSTRPTGPPTSRPRRRRFARCGPRSSTRSTRRRRHRAIATTRAARSIPATSPQDWNRSYILEPDGPAVGAVVLLHGLTDSPYSLRHVARRYRDRGFVAVAIRMPGHGTVPAALTDVEWEDWDAATRLAVREARRRAARRGRSISWASPTAARWR